MSGRSNSQCGGAFSGATEEAAVLRFDAFAFDVATRSLSRRDVEIHLTPKAAAVLHQMLERPGELISKDEFLETVWEGVHVREESLTQAISVIRQALGDSAQDPRFIQTVSGEGYRFIGAVASGSPSRSGSANDPNVEPAPRHWRRIAAAMVAIAIAGAILTFAWPSGSTSDLRAPIRSLAVLPLEHRGDPEHRDRTEGMTDLLSARLGSVGGLRVIRPDPMRRGLPGDASNSALAGDLDVDALVGGSVWWDEGTVQVVVQLVDAESGEVIQGWDDGRDAREALPLAAELTRSIVDELALLLSTEDEQRLASLVRPVAVEAYDHWAAGWAIATGRLGEGLDNAVDEFKQAIAIDEEYADAWAGLGVAYVQLGTYGLRPPDDAFPAARSAAGQAIELDGTNGHPHIVRAWVYFVYERDFERAAAEFARGIELAPNDYGAHHQHAWFQIALGRFEEAALSMENARRANPYSLVSHAQSAAPHYFERDYETALEHALRAREMDPNFGNAYVQLGRIYLAQGHTDAAIDAFEKANELSPHPRLLGDLALAFGAAGRPADAEACLNQLRDMAESTYVQPLAFAWAHLGVGDRDQALYWLWQKIPLNIEWDPKYDPLRNDPRFEKLVARVRGLREGLADQ